MFSFDNLDDPKRQALLMMAAGLLSPVRSKGMSGFGEALGKGIQGGLLGFNTAQQGADRRKQQQLLQQMQQAQLGDIQSKQAAMRGIGQSFQPGIPSMPSPDDGGPESGMIPGKPPGYDTTSAAFLEAARMRPDVAQQFMQKPKPPLVMAPGATAYDPASNKPLFTAPTAPEKADKPPELIRYQQIADDPKQPETLRRAAAAYIAKATSHAPPASVNVKVDAFTPASEEAQREFMKSSRVTYEQLKQAPVALASIEKAKTEIPSASAFMGPGGAGLLTAAKFLNNRLGFSINTEGVKSAEELRTRIFFNVLDNLKKMDAQPSQKQQEIMMAALGSLETDPLALPRVLDAFADSIRGKVEIHNQEVSGAMGRGVKFPYDPVIKVPGSNNGWSIQRVN